MNLDRRKYVALGSSFGAGPGLRPRVPGSPVPAGRSSSNYAHLVSDRIGTALDDVTFSGATVAQLRRGGPGDRAAQAASVTPDTALVTITAGGNDVGYLPALTLSSLPPLLAGPLRARRQVAAFTDPAQTDRRFAELDTQLTGLLQDLRASAPDARILLVGYLTLLPPRGTDTGRLPEPIADWGRDVARRLGDLMERATRVTGTEFVDVGAHSLEHHAWSSEPWTRRFHYTLRGGAAYHPNAAGMRAVADLVHERLRS
jgi:lysophospholipase L1-like esterase